MANIFEISKINPLRVIWQANKIPGDSGTIHYQSYHPAFNSRDFDSDFFYNSIRYYEKKEGYCQPFQQSDTLLLQFMTDDNTHTNYVGQLLDSNGGLYRSLGNPTEFSSTYDGMSVYKFSVPLYNVDEGKYFFRIVYTATTDIVLMISEPFDLKQVHPKTIRIDYWNSFNDFSYIFEDNVVPQFRVHGCITEVRPDSKFQVYEDQPLNTEMVSGIAFRNYMLSIGIGIKDVPEWVLDKLERIFLCDSVKVDNHEVTREAGSKWEGKPIERLAVGSYSLKLRERYNTDTYNVADFTTIVGAMPQTSYFFIGNMTINGATVNVQKGFWGKRNFLDYLNATQIVTKGYWSEDINNKLIFTLYEGQTTSTNALSAANTLPYCIKFKCYGTGSLKVTYTKGAAPGTTYMALVDDYTTVTTLTSYTGSLSTIKAYTGGWHNFYFYFSDLATMVDNTTTGSVIKYIGGDFPPSFKTFTFATAVGLRGIENDMFKYVTALTGFSVAGNLLYKDDVDNLLMWMYDNVTHLDATAVIVLTQSPAAPPNNVPGIAAIKAAVKAAVTTLTTD